MKKSGKNSFFIIFLSAVLITVNFISTLAAQTPEVSEIIVLVNGNPVTSEHKLLMIKGNIMAPVTEIAKKMGWTVRANSPTVYQFVKTVKYTDGNREYLFSCHTNTIDLDNERMDRSIMIGVGNFFDTADDHKINFAVNPVIIDGILFAGIEDLAKCLYADVYYDGETNTVSITSGTIPYYNGQGLSNRDELFEEMRRYNKITGTLTKIGGQNAEPEEIKPTINTSFQPSEVMAEAPKVGSVPAKILLPGMTDVKSSDSYYESYKYNISSGCNWYSYGRFYETTGILIPNQYQFGTRGRLSDIEAADLDYIRVEGDVSKITSGCIGIFIGKTAQDTGHAVFIEFVERDMNGTPKYIYYTDSNYSKTGYYDPEKDARIIKVSFEKFSKSLYQTKVFDGFIIPVQ